MQRVSLTLWVLGRSLRRRWLAGTLTALAVMLGVGLALLLPLSVAALERGALGASEGVGLLVSARGDEAQAVLSALYYQDTPPGTLPYHVYAALANDERTAQALPLHHVGTYHGVPVIATDRTLFTFTNHPAAPPRYQLLRGTPFTGPNQAVLGAQALEQPKRRGLGLGDDFTLGPQGAATPYRVVGVLAPTGSPTDRAIYVDLVSLWPSGAGGQDSSLSNIRIDAAHACLHMRHGPAEVLRASLQPGATLASAEGIHRRYDTQLAPNAAGHGGFLHYRARGSRPYIFFTDNTATLRVTAPGGALLEPDLVLASQHLTGCPGIHSAHVFTLEQGGYTMELEGDTPTLRVVVEPFEELAAVLSAAPSPAQPAPGQFGRGHLLMDQRQARAHLRSLGEAGEALPHVLAQRATGVRGGVPQIPQEDPAQEDPATTGAGVTLETLATTLDPGDPRELSAVLYSSRDPTDLARVAAQLNAVPGIQAIVPGEVVTRVLGVLGQGERTSGLLADALLALVIVTVALNTCATARQAQAERAVLRALGVARGVVAGSVLLEATLISLVGVVLGVGVAYAGSAGVSRLVLSHTGLTLPVPEFTTAEWLRASLLLPVTLGFALLPAVAAAWRRPLRP